MKRNKDKYFFPTDKKFFFRMLRSEILQHVLNTTPIWNIPLRNWLLRRLFKNVAGNPVALYSPFHCSYGDNITIGKRLFANHGLYIMDNEKVTIGDNVLFGPNVVITTVRHPIHHIDRIWSKNKNSFHPNKYYGAEINTPVVIEDNVWIASNCVICSGVTIGKNSVIGAGSVVTSDIPANVIAFGTPCKAHREITEKDRELWDNMNLWALQ